MEPYPFEDQVVRVGAIAEHFIEHLTLEEAVGWLSEVRRLLKPGGLLRLTTPDLRRYLEGYLDPDGGFFAEHRERLGGLRMFTRQRGPGPARLDGEPDLLHVGPQWIFDFDELRYAAEQAGFGTPQRSSGARSRRARSPRSPALTCRAQRTRASVRRDARP